MATQTKMAAGKLYENLTRVHRGDDSGRFLSLLLCLLVVAFMAVLLAVGYLSEIGFVPFMIASMSLMLVATTVMLIMLCTVEPEAAPTDNAAQPWRIHIRKQLVLFGMVPFYFLSVLLELQIIETAAVCWTMWTGSNNTSSETGSNQPSGTGLGQLQPRQLIPFYKAMLMVFLGFEMITCCRFHLHHFKQSHATMIALALIEATNLSLWLEMTLDESELADKHNAEHEKQDISALHNKSDPSLNVSTVCMSDDGPENALMRTSKKLLTPFTIEFLFLSIECVAHWFFSSKRDGENDGMHGHGDDDVEGRKLRHVNNLDMEHDVVGEAPVKVVRRRLGVHNVEDGELHPLIESPQRKHHRPVLKFPFYMAWVTIVGIVNVQLIYSGIAFYSFNDFENYKDLAIFYRLFYWIFVLLVIVLCSACVLCGSSFERMKQDISGVEYLVLLSIIGPISQLLLTAVAAYKTDGGQLHRYLSEEILDMVQIGAQTFLYFHVSRLQIPVNSGLKKRLLQGAVFLVIICNATLWIEDSFIETPSLGLTVQNESWHEKKLFLYVATNPLTLIYRFNSFTLFTNVYLQFI
jgi:Otopetrin